MKLKATELITGIIIGLLTNFFWSIISKQVNLLWTGVIFIVSVGSYYLFSYFVLRPLQVTRQAKLKAYYKTAATARSAIVDKLKVSSHIRIITIAGGIIAEDEQAEILELLEKRAKDGAMLIRILLLDPYSSGMDKRLNELEMLHPGKYVQAAVRKAIENNARKVLAQHQKVELRYYTSQPLWQMFILDDIAFISFYLREKEGYETQMFVFEEGSDLFTTFQRMYDSLWETGMEPMIKDIPPK